MMSACGGGSSTQGSEPSSGGNASGSYDVSSQSITFIPKQLNNPFSDVMLGGGKDAAGAIGFAEVNVVGPLEASSSSQVSFINSEVQAGTNVLVIAANDPDAVCPALQDARKAGTKVVTFDSDAAADCRDLFINQVESKQVAITMLDMVSEQIGGSGKVAILSATANAANQNAWIKFMEDEIASNDKYKGIEIVAKVYGDDDDTKSFQEAQGLLQAHPDLTRSSRDHRRHRRHRALPVDLRLQGQGRPHGPRSAQRNAFLREGRDRQGVRPVGSRPAGIRGGLRGCRAR